MSNSEEKVEVKKSTNAVIDGVAYRVNVWPATKSISYLNRLLAACGENAIPFIEGSFDFSSILRVTKLTSNSTLLDLIQEAVCSAYREGSRLDSKTFNSDFKDLLHIYKVFGWVCEVQYADFFEQGMSMNVVD